MIKLPSTFLAASTMLVASACSETASENGPYTACWPSDNYAAERMTHWTINEDDELIPCASIDQL